VNDLPTNPEIAIPATTKLPRNKFFWVIWVLIAIGFWAVVAHFNDIKNIITITGQGNWRLVGIAAFLQCCSYFLYAAVYQQAFAAVGIHSRIWQNLAVYLESLLPSIIIPAGNVAFFLRSVRKTEQSTTSGVAALLFVRIADLLSFCILFFIGLAYSAFSQQLQGFEIISAEILLVISLISIGGLLLSAYRPIILEVILHWLGRIINFFTTMISQKSSIADDWASRNANTFSQAVRDLIAHRQETRATVLLALGTHVLDLLTVFLLFLAFRQSIGIGSLLVGFVIGLFFALVPITPQGVGTVEGAMILAYSHLGVSAGAATVVTVAFRGLSFWFPAIIGFILIQGRALLRLRSS